MHNYRNGSSMLTTLTTSTDISRTSTDFIPQTRYRLSLIQNCSVRLPTHCISVAIWLQDGAWDGKLTSGRVCSMAIMHFVLYATCCTFCLLINWRHSIQKVAPSLSSSMLIRRSKLTETSVERLVCHKS